MKTSTMNPSPNSPDQEPRPDRVALPVNSPVARSHTADAPAPNALGIKACGVSLLRFIGLYLVALPIGAAAIALLGPPTAALVAIFFRRRSGPEGCEFAATGYATPLRTGGMAAVHVCRWCGRTAFQLPGRPVPKTSQCARPQFGLGDMAEAAIRIGTGGLVRKSPGCGCEKRRRQLNKLAYFRARQWWSRLATRRPLKPWNNANHAHRKFIKLGG